MRGLAVAGLALVAVLVPSTAMGAVVREGGIHYVSESFDLPTGKARTFKADCPTGTRPLAGGHYNNGGFQEVAIYHSYPFDDGDADRKPDDGWAAQSRAFDSSITATVHAACASVAVRYVKSLKSSEQGTGISGGAPCPPTHWLTGGGTKGPLNVVETGGVPAFDPPFRWETIANVYGPGIHRYASFTVCAALSEVSNATRLATDSFTATADAQTLDFAECPQEAPHVLGGAPSGLDLENSFVAASRPSPAELGDLSLDRWQVWVDNYSAAPDSVNVTAVCVSRIRSD